MHRPLLVVSSALFFWAASSGGQQSRSAAFTADDFFKGATDRLEKKISYQQIQEIQRATERKDLVAATDLIYKYSKASGTRSAVTFYASKGPEATVRYQTLGQRKRNDAPTTAKSLTAATEQLYLGRYFIWSERAGVVTSDKESQFDISGTVEKVLLQETK
jgi:hypothetical protein